MRHLARNRGYFFLPVEEGKTGIRFDQCAIGALRPGRFHAPVSNPPSTSSKSLLPAPASIGGRCKCHHIVKCAHGEPDCLRPHKCIDNDKQRRCFKVSWCTGVPFLSAADDGNAGMTTVLPSSLNPRPSQIKSCREEEYTRTVSVTLNCGDNAYLEGLSNRQRGGLARKIKGALIDRCGLKPCGYTLDAGRDLEVVDRNTISFNVQGGTVRQQVHGGVLLAATHLPPYPFASTLLLPSHALSHPPTLLPLQRWRIACVSALTSTLA